MTDTGGLAVTAGTGGGPGPGLGTGETVVTAGTGGAPGGRRGATLETGLGLAPRAAADLAN